MESLEHFTFKPSVYKNQKVIFIYFEKKYELIKIIKSIEGSVWSSKKTAWYISDTPEHRKLFNIKLIEILNEQGNLELQKFKNYLNSKRYSQNTIKTYADALQSFLIFRACLNFIQ
ncbi:integrase/recombinase XerD [Halpernia humi]|uniref:Integrase/recombinase XerD n=1 Tax=Halpernia humi TaxID=493375 RepID=A0A1H5VXD2_9FLAO|nr:hypothetical protein [Halpernia humi]SEF91793.1 integrase/recombinase XerD [Halpernia humi]